MIKYSTIKNSGSYEKICISFPTLDRPSVHSFSRYFYVLPYVVYWYLDRYVFFVCFTVRYLYIFTCTSRTDVIEIFFNALTRSCCDGFCYRLRVTVTFDIFTIWYTFSFWIVIFSYIN